jgi:hypothetical protein
MMFRGTVRCFIGGDKPGNRFRYFTAGEDSFILSHSIEICTIPVSSSDLRSLNRTLLRNSLPQLITGRDCHD